MCRHAPVAFPQASYFFTEEEARESVNGAYDDPRAWDTGCRSWHNGGVGDGSVGLTFIAGPFGRYALVASGRDEGYLQQAVCCSTRGGVQERSDCFEACYPALPVLARSVKSEGRCWGTTDYFLAATAGVLIFLTACLGVAAACLR